MGSAMSGYEGPSLKKSHWHMSMIKRATLSFCSLLALILISKLFRINSDYSSFVLVFLNGAIWAFPENIGSLRPTKKSETLFWQNGKLTVTARMTPKYLWTTASIDVYLDEKCILKTRGQRATRGTKINDFQYNGRSHVVELSWTPPRNGLFYPFRLAIDQQIIDSAEVYIRNWPLAIVGALLIVGVILGIPAILINAYR